MNVGSRNSTALGQFTNYDDISALPMAVSNTYLHCVFVPSGTAIAGVSIPFLTVNIDGSSYSCVNFGVVRWPRIGITSQQLPKMYKLTTSAGAYLTENNLQTSVPGRDDYFGMVWVQSATLLDTPTTTLTSTEALLSSVRSVVTTPYTAVSIFISSN